MELLIYRNKRNDSKYLEVHKYKCSHYRVRQFILNQKGYNYIDDVRVYNEEDIIYYTGSPRHGKRKLDSWKVFGSSRKINNGLKTLLEDYELVDKDRESIVYDTVKKWKGWCS